MVACVPWSDHIISYRYYRGPVPTNLHDLCSLVRRNLLEYTFNALSGLLVGELVQDGSSRVVAQSLLIAAKTLKCCCAAVESLDVVAVDG